MKLLMAARRYPPDVRSGTETVFEALYAHVRRRHEVRLVVGWTRARDQVPAEAVAVPLRGLAKGASHLSLARAIWWESRRFQPDVVLSNSIEVPPTGRPTACIVHDLNFGGEDRGFEASMKRRFYVARARRLDVVIAVSEATSRSLVGLGVEPDRIRTVHNGVDLIRFRPRAPGEASPVTLGEPGLVQLIYPARILPGKGQHHAIDAVARLRRDYKARVHLTLVGAVADPVYLDQLRVQAYGQPVSFALDVPDMAPYLRAADIALFPTIMQEGFGYSAVEAMASGLPVIWFDQPAIREATGGLGLAVTRDDVDGLRAAIMRLVDHPDERVRIGQEGRAWCERNLRWEDVWSRYEAILGAIAAKPR